MMHADSSPRPLPARRPARELSRRAVVARAFAALAALAALAGPLTGCGGGDSNATGLPMPSSTPVASATPVPSRSPDPSGLPLSEIKLPPGFEITVFAHPVPRARAMALGPRGTLFVGNFDQVGKVWALRDEDGDGVAERKVVLATGPKLPVGVDVHDGD
ncbi:MAG: hypothetical protein ACKO2K_07215, partial [Alphaproteobacteria bacterium]